MREKGADPAVQGRAPGEGAEREKVLPARRKAHLFASRAANLGGKPLKSTEAAPARSKFGQTRGKSLSRPFERFNPTLIGSRTGKDFNAKTPRRQDAEKNKYGEKKDGISRLRRPFQVALNLGAKDGEASP